MRTKFWLLNLVLVAVLTTPAVAQAPDPAPWPSFRLTGGPTLAESFSPTFQSLVNSYAALGTYYQVEDRSGWRGSVSAQFLFQPSGVTPRDWRQVTTRWGWGAGGDWSQSTLPDSSFLFTEFFLGPGIQAQWGTLSASLVGGPAGAWFQLSAKGLSTPIGFGNLGLGAQGRLGWDFLSLGPVDLGVGCSGRAYWLLGVSMAFFGADLSVSF